MLNTNTFLAVAFLTTGCSVQLAEPLVSKIAGQSVASVTPTVSEVTVPNNDVDNFLVINRVSAYPAVVATSSFSTLAVDYSDALGRPVGVTWECNKGVLLSDKGQKTTWYAPDTPGAVCDCEVTVRSRSGLVRASVRLMVKDYGPADPNAGLGSFSGKVGSKI